MYDPLSLEVWSITFPIGLQIQHAEDLTAFSRFTQAALTTALVPAVVTLGMKRSINRLGSVVLIAVAALDCALLASLNVAFVLNFVVATACWNKIPFRMWLALPFEILFLQDHHHQSVPNLYSPTMGHWTDTNGSNIRCLPPKNAEVILPEKGERKARTTLLMALPEDHLAKFHKMTDAKEMWDAIKSRFGGNDESKKMFQSLLSQLEIHGACVSIEDENQKFLRSVPSSRSQVSLVMRTKPGVDSLSFDDLYNNLRVFESDVKGSNGSSSSAQNVAFVSSESTSSTNDVSTAYGVSTSSGYNSQRENSSSYTDELMYSFFANQSSGPQLDHEDLEQLDEFDLEEMDLK
ncbi:hypothetical protein Tco_1506859 [Tanacetum coccineum]